MTEEVVVKPLSEVERVVDVFVAPSKTFTDILRSTSWILPFVLMVVVTLGVDFTIDKQVGFDRVSENQLHLSPKREEQLSQLTPEQRAQNLRISAVVTKYISFGSPVLILIFTAIGSLVLWGCFNFGLGAKTTFGQMFAVWTYASLPRLLSGLLTILTLSFGNNQDSFNIQNAVGTNIAYYVPDAAPWLKAALGFIDVIGLWNTALLVMGTSIVAKVKMSSAAIVVVGLWLLMLLLSVGGAAATS
jgi:hypothetical protein